MRRALAASLATIALAGCGSGGTDRAPSLAEARQELAGSPGALAALHAQANQVLGGGSKATLARLAALRGHPVVVNKWASWCAPCRAEFPVLRRVSAKRGKEVAFLGLDARDNDAAARRYLARFPLSYPSYADAREQTARVLRAPEGFPITNFYDRAGRLVYQHAGPYRSDAALERDIDRYARGT